MPSGLHPGQAGYEPWHKWHDDQNGQGSGNCTQSVFPILIPEVERHEGLTFSDASHYAVAVKAYSDLEFAERLERVVVESTDDYTIQQAVFSEWKKFHEADWRYLSRQQNFELEDYPRMNARLGCKLDYTGGDK